jgi:hypothetical protein
LIPTTTVRTRYIVIYIYKRFGLEPSSFLL